MVLNNKKLILASGSPRRKQLLESANLDFEVVKINVDESFPTSLAVSEIAEYLAVKKSEEGYDLKFENEILITADTVVGYGDTDFGKPASKEECIEVLLQLSDVEHDVFTGVCLRSLNKKHSFTTHSIVKFANITKDEASWYFDNFNPIDKAGSYGIQDWIGICKVEYIKGSYTNILGLPVTQLLSALLVFCKVE